VVLLVLTRFFFEYARLYIITRDKGVFESIGLSLTMAIENIGITIRLFFSLMLVYAREILLLIGIFVLPVLLSWLFTLGLAEVFLQGVFVIIALVYIAFLIIVSAMNSVIEVFVESLWYSVFLDNEGSGHAGHASGGHGHDSHHH